MRVRELGLSSVTRGEAARLRYSKKPSVVAVARSVVRVSHAGVVQRASVSWTSTTSLGWRPASAASAAPVVHVREAYDVEVTTHGTEPPEGVVSFATICAASEPKPLPVTVTLAPPAMVSSMAAEAAAPPAGATAVTSSVEIH